MAIVLALTVMNLSCSRVLPWADEPVGQEVNLAFTLDRNLVRFESVTIDNRAGHFILGTAARRSVVDSGFALSSRRVHALQFGERETLRLEPARADLRGATDAILGADTWKNRAISIDYRSGLVTWQKDGIKTGLMEIFRFPAEPMITVHVNGREIAAIVDTASPDTLVLPGRVHGRAAADVRIGRTDFGSIDVQYADVSRARVGNRLLSRYLVTIDYGRKVVGLWRDPRIPLSGPARPAALVAPPSGT